MKPGLRRPARPRLLVAALVAVGLLLAVVPGAGPFGAAAHAATGTGIAAAGPGRAADPAHPLTVAITALDPVSLSPGDTLVVDGTVVNDGDTPLDGLSPTIGMLPRITTRGGLAEDLAGAPGIAKVLTTTRGSFPTSLAPGGRASFRVAVPLAANGLDGNTPAVYPLRVRFDSGSATSLGQADTYVPYFPGSVANPLRIAWVWPLVSAPATATDGSVLEPDVPATFDVGGRLRRLLTLATAPPAAHTKPAPVTFALDSSLLEAIATVGSSWTRTGSQQTNEPSPAARTWLRDLRAATAGRDVVALPYADPDAVALVRAGLSEDLASSAALSRSAVAAALPDTALLPVAWPVGGAVDQATLDAYAGTGATAVLVDSDQVPPRADSPVPTTSAPTELDTRGPKIRGIALDHAAAELLAGDGRDAGSPRMAVQKLLALLALTVDEQPNGSAPRDLVLALPRDADPDPTWARALLHDTANVPWLTAISLGSVLSDPLGDRQGLMPYPASARAAEIPQPALVGPGATVTGLRDQISALRAMLPDDALTKPLDRALSRAESLAWRSADAAPTRAALLDGVQRGVSRLRAGVTVGVVGQVTLTSGDGKLPVTVRNTLSEPVTVVLTLSSADPSKLTSPGAVRAVVRPGEKQRVLLPAKTQRAGTFRVQLTLATPSGLFIAGAPVTVHSTAYGTITLVITLVALGILVAALAVRLVRRVLRWRARPAAGGARP